MALRDHWFNPDRQARLRMEEEARRAQSEQEFQQKLKKYSIDAVISGNCGCGICTVNETGNGLAAEYAGVPAVVVGAEAFIPQIESTGYSRGVPVVRTRLSAIA